MNYFEVPTKRVYTEELLKIRGIDINNQQVLDALQLFPLQYEEPEITDRDLYFAEADGEPVFQEAENTYLQHMKVTPYDLDTAKRVVKERITAKRWEVETGGITVEGAGKILTAIDDQNRISSAIAGIETAGIDAVDFKAADGWVHLTKAELLGIAALIVKHVQACFSQERALHELTDAATSVEDLLGIDITEGWPAN